MNIPGLCKDSRAYPVSAVAFTVISAIAVLILIKLSTAGVIDFNPTTDTLVAFARFVLLANFGILAMAVAAHFYFKKKGDTNSEH